MVYSEASTIQHESPPAKGTHKEHHAAGGGQRHLDQLFPDRPGSGWVSRGKDPRNGRFIYIILHLWYIYLIYGILKPTFVVHYLFHLQKNPRYDPVL